jgi:DNA gyrase subunit B
MTTPNQDNPLMNVIENGGFPLLGLDLWETTLNPENNTLLKVNYSGNDVDNETTNPGDRDREIFKILMGEDVVPRKDFINKNAINVNNLDI